MYSWLIKGYRNWAVHLIEEQLRLLMTPQPCSGGRFLEAGLYLCLAGPSLCLAGPPSQHHLAGCPPAPMPSSPTSMARQLLRCLRCEEKLLPALGVWEQGKLSSSDGWLQSLFLKMAVNRFFFTPSIFTPTLSGGNCIAIHCPVTWGDFTSQNK